MDVDERQEERHSAGSCQRRHGAGPMEAATVQRGGVTCARVTGEEMEIQET